jgi:hypothetical protein
MCHLAEIRENLLPIIDEMMRRRRFDETGNFNIGDPENNEKLALVLREDNLHNTVSAIILFENIELQIRSHVARLDFQIILRLGETNDINAFDLELLLIPNNILQAHDETEVSKDIISCWNNHLVDSA